MAGGRGTRNFNPNLKAAGMDEYTGGVDLGLVAIRPCVLPSCASSIGVDEKSSIWPCHMRHSLEGMFDVFNLTNTSVVLRHVMSTARIT